ncbi:MAG: carboxypeptidase regulatory-like domain-containing protein [Gammaproteobacteria bacterium]|nr:carboxypeptidase regulatory-like domain-containing protein [Gammaproteobacteria bacterium]NIR84369.1 carboxypeptidase regulatory-like domain-containing protein [Gammaproteobacteria bacterium]NIR89885.1 carboxypeptidase regulatory-like domain-containing protein [Gammaproteobacteria bacterium]NIU05752.1 carboxypeptidase regulatory-like domain-containing protein [Gammaproteobacteria bacterium]NIV52512.1 hypothetical protein [Gammaproteobacteria bacterium]
MNLRRILLIAVVLPALAAPFAVQAEHEANHRYTVRGYVLDAQRQPVPDAPVSIRMGGDLVGSTRTDAEGFYSIRAHLHDTDLGRKLTVRAGEHQAEVRMEGTPGDVTTERIHHVNLVGGELVERELARGGVPGWGYAAGGLVLASTGVVVAQRLRRRSKRLRRQEQAAAQPQRSKKEKRKRKRRKR